MGAGQDASVFHETLVAKFALGWGAFFPGRQSATPGDRNSTALRDFDIGAAA